MLLTDVTTTSPVVCISGGLQEYNGGGSRLKQKQKTRIGIWDKEREPWKIMFYPTDDFRLSDQNLEGSVEGVHVQPQVRRSSNVNIPNAGALPQLEQKDDSDVLEWEEGLSSLLEWVGLACLDSQRYIYYFGCMVVADLLNAFSIFAE